MPLENHLDPELLAVGDRRNVVDKYRNWRTEAIRADLKRNSHDLEIAIENLTRDFNMGTIVRSANAFNVRRVHIIGRRQWNKRGAMMTDSYLELLYHASVEDFLQQIEPGYQLIAIDNQAGAKNLSEHRFSDKTILIFGSEADGISPGLAAKASLTLQIEQFGSTRSLNVGVAAGIVMYEWMRQQVLSKSNHF